MPTKASEVITDALEDLVEEQEEADVPQAEGRAGIRALNDMMFDWAVNGIDLGYTEIDDLGGVLTVPPGAIRGIKANLAMDLATKYEITPTPGLIKKAKEGYRTCVLLASERASMEYPSTLPQGSGNTYPSYADNTFYPDLEDTILTETGGSIALEADTEES